MRTSSWVLSQCLSTVLFESIGSSGKVAPFQAKLMPDPKELVIFLGKCSWPLGCYSLGGHIISDEGCPCFIYICDGTSEGRVSTRRLWMLDLGLLFLSLHLCSSLLLRLANMCQRDVRRTKVTERVRIIPWMGTSRDY